MKKTIWAIGLLLIGCLTGWFVFYRFGNVIGLPGGRSGGSRPVVIPFTGVRDFSGIVKAVSPSVVNISSQRLVPKAGGDGLEGKGAFSEAPGMWSEKSLGSGVIVSPDGYIITNNHVIADSDEITVTLLDKRTFDGKVIGTDPTSDIALVKIQANHLPILKLANPNSLRVGEWTVAIGSPLGFQHSVTAGILSAMDREISVDQRVHFLQTSAPINPGNSGGPLLNMR
ncbi:MAG: trypsin-like peptidase domain-containing protein, partial [Nitrospiraceae bacterium]|nr:trypsin-like peptidase domain-containing protein [Nitrospiraceae bacterium]